MNSVRQTAMLRRRDRRLRQRLMLLLLLLCLHLASLLLLRYCSAIEINSSDDDGSVM